MYKFLMGKYEGEQEFKRKGEDERITTGMISLQLSSRKFNVSTITQLVLLFLFMYFIHNDIFLVGI